MAYEHPAQRITLDSLKSNFSGFPAVKDAFGALVRWLQTNERSWIGVDQLADRAGVHRCSVMRMHRWAEFLGLIEVIKETSPGKSPDHNRYIPRGELATWLDQCRARNAKGRDTRLRSEGYAAGKDAGRREQRRTVRNYVGRALAKQKRATAAYIEAVDTSMSSSLAKTLWSAVSLTFIGRTVRPIIDSSSKGKPFSEVGKADYDFEKSKSKSAFSGPGQQPGQTAFLRWYNSQPRRDCP